MRIILSKSSPMGLKAILISQNQAIKYVNCKMVNFMRKSVHTVQKSETILPQQKTNE